MVAKIKVKFVRTGEEVKAPYKGTAASAGWDLCATEDIYPTKRKEGGEWVKIAPSEPQTIGTGIKAEIPKGYFGMLSLRSGISARKHIRLSNGVGIIDSDYRGEIKGVVYFTRYDDQQIEKGERVFQLTIIKQPDAAFEEVDALSESERGEGGYGSTGEKVPE